MTGTAFFLLCCVFGAWLGEVAGLILCNETCASPGRGNASVCLQEADHRQEIALLGLFPCNTPIFQARGLTVAGQMAVRQISFNGSTAHLLPVLAPVYRLKLYVENSEVRTTVAACTKCISGGVQSAIDMEPAAVLPYQCVNMQPWS